MMTREQALICYRVAETSQMACQALWGKGSDEAMLAADLLLAAMKNLFFAGGHGEDIEREQEAVARAWARVAGEVTE